MTEIGRLITAMVTPFDAEGNVDYGQAKRLATALLDSGSDGLVVTGTTGESPTLTHDEKLRLYSEIKGQIGDRGAVIAGTGSYNTAESIELTRAAEKAGADAILLVVPYYNNPPQDGLYQHFKKIAEATSLPCILYNVPTRTVRNLEAGTAIRLSQIPNIIGLKEASANFDQIGKIISGTGDGFRIWSGNDGDTLAIMAMGGYGVISVASHLVGAQIKSMMESLLAGDVQHAGRMHHKLMPLINALFVVANPIPVKYCLNRIGFNVGSPRLPLVEADDKTAAQIDAVLAEYKLDLPVGVTS